MLRNFTEKIGANRQEILQLFLVKWLQVVVLFWVKPSTYMLDVKFIYFIF